MLYFVSYCMWEMCPRCWVSLFDWCDSLALIKTNHLCRQFVMQFIRAVGHLPNWQLFNFKDTIPRENNQISDHKHWFSRFGWGKTCVTEVIANKWIKRCVAFMKKYTCKKFGWIQNVFILEQKELLQILH